MDKKTCFLTSPYSVWFGLRKEKNLKMLVTSSELYLLVWSIYSIQGTEEEKNNLLVSWSRLPSLARVLLCLGKVGVPRVSWSGQSGIWTSFHRELCYLV